MAIGLFSHAPIECAIFTYANLRRSLSGSLALLGCAAAAAVLAVFMLGADCDKQRAHTHTIALGKNVRFVMTTILLSVVCAVCSEPRVCLHLLDIRYL